MAGQPTFVIVGANLTGGAAATTLRGEGFDGRIVLVGEEPYPPYERPPLSKEYLRGEQDFDASLLTPAAWYEENGVDLLLGRRVRGIDPSGRTVSLDGPHDRIAYDRLLIATGGRNRVLRVPGGDLEGIHGLRTREDADRIRAEAARGGTAVVVGAGFIGVEVAASLRALGVDVEVVEIFETTLVRALGARVGRVFEEVHRDHGVRFHLDQEVARFQGNGRVSRVVTDRGRAIDCDFVVVGIGIEPATTLAEGAGIRVDNGVVVDERCRTDVEGIFAAGDVANHFHPVFGRHVRMEHWDNALKQGAAAARTMTGRTEPFDDPHWFWSDQYDQNLQVVGDTDPSQSDDLVVRGNMEERNFLAFYLKEGGVRGVAGLNRGREVRRSAGLVRAGATVAPATLMDPDVDLKELAATVSKVRPS